MKLTTEDILNEESGKAKPKRGKKEKAPRKRLWGKEKETEIEPEDEDSVEEEEFEEAAIEDAEPDDDAGGETDDAEPEETEEDTEDTKSNRMARVRTGLLILAAVVGFALIVAGIRGVVNKIRLEDTVQTPAESYDPSYEDALNASDEEFEQANAQREAEVPEGEQAPVEGTPEPAPEDTGEIVVENPENKTSPEEEIALLKGEVERLNQAVLDAQNNEALMEQELNNAKAMLEAATLREAQLQSQLDAANAEK